MIALLWRRESREPFFGAAGPVVRQTLFILCEAPKAHDAFLRCSATSASAALRWHGYGSSAIARILPGPNHVFSLCSVTTVSSPSPGRCSPVALGNAFHQPAPCHASSQVEEAKRRFGLSERPAHAAFKTSHSTPMDFLHHTFLNDTPRWLDQIVGVVLWIALVVTAWRSSRAFAARRGRKALVARLAGIALLALAIFLIELGLMSGSAPALVAGLAGIIGGVILFLARHL